MDWFETRTTQVADLIERASSGARHHDWPGMRIYHGHSAADLDLPEGYPLNHGLGWSCCRRPTSLLYRLSGSGWMRDDGMPLGFFPAGMPYAVRSRRSREFVLTEFTPEFVAAVQGPDRRGVASLR